MMKDQFFFFKARVQQLLKTRHGISLNDCTDDLQLHSAHAAGDSPHDFVEWIAGKYDLDRVDQSSFGG